MEGLVAGAGIVVILISFVFYSLIYAAFLLLAAKIVDIPGRSFGKALLSAVIGTIGSLIIFLVLMFIPILGWLLAIVAGFAITAIVVQGFFKTSFGKALGASVIGGIFTTIVFGIIFGILAFGVGLTMMGAGA